MNAASPLPGAESDGDDGARTKGQQVTCGGCDATWTAPTAAHCGSCHALFASVSLFARHRSQDGDHGACIPPGEVQGRNGEQRLFFRDGMWRGPELSDEQRDRLRGLAS